MLIEEGNMNRNINESRNVHGLKKWKSNSSEETRCCVQPANRMTDKVHYNSTASSDDKERLYQTHTGHRQLGVRLRLENQRTESQWCFGSCTLQRLIQNTNLLHWLNQTGLVLCLRGAFCSLIESINLAHCAVNAPEKKETILMELWNEMSCVPCGFSLLPHWIHRNILLKPSQAVRSCSLVSDTYFLCRFSPLRSMLVLCKSNKKWKKKLVWSWTKNPARGNHPLTL